MGDLCCSAPTIALLLILLVAAGLRSWQIDTLPPGFHFDESFEGLEAWRILTDSAYRPIFLSGNFGVAPLNAYANTLMFGLFQILGGEPGPTAMRVTAACFGVLTVLAVYGLGQEVRALEIPQLGLSEKFPLFAAATLAVMRWHIHFSRMGIEPVLVPLLWASATWLLLRGWRTGSWWSFAGCGIFLAAAMYAYQGAWIIPFLTVFVCLVLLLQRLEIGNWRFSVRPIQSPITNLQSQQTVGLIITAAIACVLVAPLGWFFWRNPDLFLLRPAQIAVVGDAGTATNNSVWGMVWATAKMFGPFGAPGDLEPRRNLPGAPALNLWLAIPFYVGLVIASWRAMRPAYAALLIGLVGLLLPGVFSEYAPHFHRILGAAAPTALLCGIGLDRIAEYGIRSSEFRSQYADRTRFRIPYSVFRTPYSNWVRWVSVLLLVLGGVVSARDYFGRWAALPDLFYAFDVGLWQVGQAIAALPPDQQVYLTPRDASHPTLAFALQTKTGGHPAPVAFDGRFVFPLTAQTTSQPELYAVIEQEDFRTRLLLPEIFPAAIIQRALPDRQGQMYAQFYERPAKVIPQRPPQHAFATELGDGIALVGYDVQPATYHAGDVLYLQLHWRVDAAPAGDWTVFTHLLATGAAGNVAVVAGRDSRPGNGSLPTTRWQPGWRILDEYQIALPVALEPGIYQLEVGLYQPSGERLPVDQPSVLLGEVRIE